MASVFHKHILISSLASDFNLQLEQVESEKLLGIHIDRSLSFTKHVDFVCKNISS